MAAPRPPTASAGLSIELEYKPDADRACERMAAWWEGEVLDRPAFQVRAPRPHPRPAPARHHPRLRDRWMDVQYQVECADVRLANTYWGGEWLPAWHPNLGPDLLAACYGAELAFGEQTSWSQPVPEAWPQALELRTDNVYFRTIMEMTRRGLEVGRGRFLVGITDLHPGGDLAAALRGSERFLTDLALEPEEARRLLDMLKPSFYEFFEHQHRILSEGGQRITTTWLPLFCEGRYYPVSEDIACMLSEEMFRKFLLPEIIDEVHWLDRSIFHLDGPEALRHLDALLEIDELDAIQFVCGAGAQPASRWMHVLGRIQEAGKNIHVSIQAKELDRFMENLRPEGVMLAMGAESVEHAEALIADVAAWPRRG